MLPYPAVAAGMHTSRMRICAPLLVCAVRDNRSLMLNTVAAVIFLHFTCNSN